jgi:hypothetical protein
VTPGYDPLPVYGLTTPHLRESAALPKLDLESDRGIAPIAKSFVDEIMRRVL